MVLPLLELVPEAANLWALETFPTDQRATCYAVVNVVFQASAAIVSPVGGAFVAAVDYDPEPLLLGYASIQLLLGVYTCFLPNETANKALTDVTVPRT